MIVTCLTYDDPSCPRPDSRPSDRIRERVSEHTFRAVVTLTSHMCADPTVFITRLVRMHQQEVAGPIIIPQRL